MEKEGREIEEVLKEYKGIKYSYKEFMQPEGEIVEVRIYHSIKPQRLFIGEGEFEESRTEYKVRNSLMKEVIRQNKRRTLIWNPAKYGSMNLENVQEYLKENK